MNKLNRNTVKMPHLPQTIMYCQIYRYSILYLRSDICIVIVFFQEHSTINWELPTVKKENSTINWELPTVNKENSTVDYENSTVNCEHSTVNCEHSTVNCEHSTVNYEHLTVN